ncbi:hypothetical protein E4U55_000261 [Claviceps digitariae]|nr:hypothetical protein E4U55_000261 [Claviceps digitariae]
MQKTVGLERLMRLLQSIFTILTCYPRLLRMLLPGWHETVRQRSQMAMLELAGHLNLTRRALRLFWCLGSFQSSWSACLSGSSEESLERWLSITADSFFGLFGLVESITLLDLMQGRYFSVLGYAEAVRLDGQAQGLWLAGLLCAVLGSGMRLWREGFVERGEESRAGGEAAGAGAGAGGDEKDDETAAARTTMTMKDGGAGAEKQKQKQKRKQDRDREALRKEHGRRMGGLARKLAAEMLDVVIPAWSTGLADIELGTVAVAMFLSTILTGYAVWERCGLAIDGKRQLA